MPLSEKEKLELRDLLRITPDGGNWIYSPNAIYESLDRQLDALSDAQVELIQEVLATWSTVKNTDNSLIGDFNQSTRAIRNRLYERTVAITGFDPRLYQNGQGNPFRIGRA